MDKELRTWANDMIASINDVAERIANDALSDKDRNSFGVMLIQLEQAIKKDPEYEEASAITTKLQESFNALMDNNARLLQQHQDEMRQIMLFGDIMITEEDKQKFAPREDGRTYIDNLPVTQHDVFMQYIEQLKLIGAKYDSDINQWYVEEDWQAPETEKNNNLKKEGNGLMSKENNEINNSTSEKFRAVYYENSERKELFADTKDAAIALVKNAKSSVQENDRCYIQELGDNGKYNAEGIYLIDSGKDITPVEINLPYMSPEAFKEVRDEIKALGAKFNAEEKMWYIERSEPQETLQNIQSILDSHDANTYLNLPYMSPDTYKAVREGIKEMGAKFNGDKKKWYVDYSAPQETIEDIKNFIAAHDEAVYLQLPNYQNKKEFSQMIQQFKQDGAKFNPDKKAWYITDKQDAGKFAAYLKTEKSSVLDKLEHNKEAAAKNGQKNDAVKEFKNKEADLQR